MKIAKGKDMKEKVKKTKAHTPKAKVKPPRESDSAG